MATLNNQRVTYSQTRGNWCSKLCISVYIPEKLCLSIMSCFSCWECHWIGIWRFPICSYMDFLLYVLYVPISSWVCAYTFRFYVIFPIFSYNFMDVFLYFPWLSCKTTGYFARHWLSMENFLHHFFGLPGRLSTYCFSMFDMFDVRNEHIIIYWLVVWNMNFMTFHEINKPTSYWGYPHFRKPPQQNLQFGFHPESAGQTV